MQFKISEKRIEKIMSLSETGSCKMRDARDQKHLDQTYTTPELPLNVYAASCLSNVVRRHILAFDKVGILQMLPTSADLSIA
jgi:hypothetical protein